MAELGGTSTQAGIFYQNSVAALALLNLLDLSPKVARERVVDVRVEAPSHVDDVVVHHADGHFQYWNVKLSISPSDRAWKNFWRSLKDQWCSDEFSTHDELVIVISEQSVHSKALSELCERAGSSLNNAEFELRLTIRQSELFSNIADLTALNEEALEFFRHLTVRHLTENEINSEFDRRRLAGNFILPNQMLSTLRDIVGSSARRRGIFLAPNLRYKLQYEYNIELKEPIEWGLPAYRKIISELSIIEIPGTNLSGSVDELFVWPRAKTYAREHVSDFEDENLNREYDFNTSSVDLQSFPSLELAKAIIVAGPGHGKSALLTAVAARLSKGPYIPISISLASLGASELSVLEFLSSEIEREMSLKADWPRLAEQGLLVLLFDGLDEVPPTMRSILLNRISIFSARHPNVPWLLTVRDPAALSGSSEVPIIELLPLDDDDIVRFVDTMRSKLKLAEGWKFLNKLKLYSDLEKLARIPLFLSMLLATMDLDKMEAITRSDLIEAYLKTLFSPAQHKITLLKKDRSLGLRAISEKLAFDRLEKHEIGASEKEVRDAIRHVVQDFEEGQIFFEQLLANGILKQQSSIRYQFPYPIVQEYLAACYLLSEFPESLPSRIDEAIQRPWAQVLQFALEQHPNPTSAIKEIIQRDDDAFRTKLRLVGRCITNGAKVDNELVCQVGDLLVDFWKTAPTRAREKVGRLLLDGFISPPSNSLKKALHHSWLNSSSGGEIVSRIDDTELTLSVLKNLLETNVHGHHVYHDMRSSLNSAGDVAIHLIIDLIKTPNLESKKIEEMLSVLWNFSSNSVNRDLVLTIAIDKELSNQSRMYAFELAGVPLDSRALPLIREALLAENWDEHYKATALFKLIPKYDKFVCDILENPKISKERKLKIVEPLPYLFPEVQQRKKVSQLCLGSLKIDFDLRIIFKLFEARYGCREIFVKLIDSIQDISVEYVGVIISLFGHYPDKYLAERAAIIVSERKFLASEIVQLARSAATGMRYVYEMDSFRSGTVKNTLPHPGIAYWRELVEDWSLRNDLKDIERLSIVTCGVGLGSVRCIRKLETILISIIDFDDDKWDEDEHKNANELSNALHELSNTSPVFSNELIDRLLCSSKYNVSSCGVRALERLGRREALEKLICFHAKVSDWYLRDTAANAIETLSARLSLPIEKDEQKYKISENIVY